jgi:ectoine utilization protein EutC
VKITILTEKEIRSCVQLDHEALEVVAQGFTKLAQGKATLPPILRVDVPENRGEVDVKTAYVHGLDHFAIKIASGFLDNSKRGLPTGSGMMVVVSAVTGFPEAVLLDNGYLTDVRTGAAGGIAAQHLAREVVGTAGVIGAGMQARFQIRALKLVRDFQRLLVYSIVPEECEVYASEMREGLGVEVIIAESAQAVVEGCDVLVTSTPSRVPYLQAEWLHPGLHITCMGSDAEHKQELQSTVFARADRIVCDRKSQCFRLGELHHALEAGVLSESDSITELGELTSGSAPGRQSEDEITVCDLTGVGVQDTQIALLAFKRAIQAGLGVPFGD